MSLLAPPIPSPLVGGDGKFDDRAKSVDIDVLTHPIHSLVVAKKSDWFTDATVNRYFGHVQPFDLNGANDSSPQSPIGRRIDARYALQRGRGHSTEPTSRPWTA